VVRLAATGLAAVLGLATGSGTRAPSVGLARLVTPSFGVTVSGGQLLAWSGERWRV